MQSLSRYKWGPGFMMRVLVLLFMLCGHSFVSLEASAAIHSAPVVLQGYKIKAITHYQINMYRLFRTGSDGEAVPIPFQIDEINEWGDYVLDEGGPVTANTGNGIFDLQDEIAFMGDDVGIPKAPTSWEKVGKPSMIYEVKTVLGKPESPNFREGAVYIGIYFQKPPPLSTRNYVFFKRDSAEVITSRYRYEFDQKNWLVSRRVEMLKKGTEGKPEFVPLLESTTFYMKADLKYFLTIEANHRSINSDLEAFKVGPIRSIVRISFHYTFLKLNFELGMYTEISFFANAVFLPAIMYNPLDGQKSLNAGSGFSYGMALRDNPKSFDITSNMPPYKEAGFLDFFKATPKSEDMYWIMANGKDRMLYMEIAPSRDMRKAGAVPMLYREDIAGSQIKSRGAKNASPLGKSPVNMGLHFDMTKFSEGEHVMAFRLFFENENNKEKLQSFQDLGKWATTVRRVAN